MRGGTKCFVTILLYVSVIEQQSQFYKKNQMLTNQHILAERFYFIDQKD